jgi:sigma-B regulation protein RsbU (phosphoserine phosphatase)
MRIDTRESLLEFASGGHPPAYLRAVDGTIDELQATSFVLGACADKDYDPEPITRRFGPGDALIAFTDGAMEARNDKGAMFGLDRLRSLLVGSPPHPETGWAGSLLSAVEDFRFGPPGDDTLVIEIARPLDMSRIRAQGGQGKGATSGVQTREAKGQGAKV